MNSRALRQVTLSSAVVGALVWLCMATVTYALLPRLNTYELMFLLAPLVIVPLSLALLIGPHTHSKLFTLACFIQPPAALLVVVSFACEPGVLTGILILPWLLMCTLIAIAGLTNWMQTRSLRVSTLTACAGMLYLAGGGSALVLSRAGLAPFGFEEPIVLLTAVHFHFTGFAVPVLASAMPAVFSLSAREQRTHAVAAIALIVATPLLAAGWMLNSPGWKLLCVLALVMSLSLLAALAIRIVLRPGQGFPRALLAVSGGSVLFGMVLAGLYGAGEFAGHSLIGLHDMALLHGVANGIGFTLCGLLAMNLTVQKEKPA